MKNLLICAILLPAASFAQSINTMNNPNLPDYQNPSQQRMQQQMQSQQIQQQNMLNQQLQTQSNMQRQQLNSQMNSNTQRIIQSQPGTNQRNGLPDSKTGSGSSQHMLSPQPNEGMLR